MLSNYYLLDWISRLSVFSLLQPHPLHLYLHAYDLDVMTQNLKEKFQVFRGRTDLEYTCTLLPLQMVLVSVRQRVKNMGEAPMRYFTK